MQPQSPAPEKSSDADTIETLGSTLMIIQFLLLGVLAFGDIGFDHPGRYGLSFNHFLLVSGLYLITLVFGLICSVSERSWNTLAAQLGIPATILLFLLWPAPEFDAGEYQHLKSMSAAEVRSELGTAPVVTGHVMAEDGSHAFDSYRGMKIEYSPEGRVISVKATGDLERCGED